jgi:hypothetical protein
VPPHNASLGSLKKALFGKKLFEKNSKILINKIKKTRSLERVPVSLLAQDNPR